MENKFSVLMSLYYKEKPEYLSACLDSILNQSLMPDEIVIVKDGPLTEGLEEVLYKLVPLENNKGLGLALAEGILHCKYELVARMDTDDICRKDRFELQIKEFEKNPFLDICGSHIKEFEGTTDNIVSTRNVPLNDAKIKEYQKRRDSFNHMTVMYKKSSVLKAGNYQSCMLMEDTYLWVNMFLSGCNAINIDDYLVYARVGKDMYNRRGGLSYFKKYKNGRKKIKQTGYISFWDYYYTLIIQFIVAVVPNKVRKLIYKKLLRK